MFVRRKTSRASKLAISKSECTAKWNPLHFLRIVDSVHRECECVGNCFMISNRSKQSVCVRRTIVEWDFHTNACMMILHCNVLQNVCIGCVWNRVSCFTIIPLHDFWIAESEPMCLCTFQVHWFQQWILRAYIHSDTINQQTKTKYINNKISLFDMGFIAFSLSHTFQIFHNTMYTNNFIDEKKCCSAFPPVFQPTH